MIKKTESRAALEFPFSTLDLVTFLQNILKIGAIDKY